MRAIAAGASLIGINNRDLQTFETDLARDGRTASARSRAASLVLSESGVRCARDMQPLYRRRGRGFLVGESLMRAADQAEFVGALRATVPAERRTRIKFCGSGRPPRSSLRSTPAPTPSASFSLRPTRRPARANARRSAPRSRRSFRRSPFRRRSPEPSLRSYAPTDFIAPILGGESPGVLRRRDLRAPLRQGVPLRRRMRAYASADRWPPSPIRNRRACSIRT